MRARAPPPARPQVGLARLAHFESARLGYTRDGCAWRGGVGGGGQPPARSKCSPPTRLASLATLPATKPGLARVWQKIVRKSGKPDLRGREGRCGASVLNAACELVLEKTKC